MKPYLIIAAALVLAGCGGDKSGPAANPAAAPSDKTVKVSNSGFEQAGDDGTIPGWTPMMHADPASFRIGIDAETAHQGHASLHIARVHNEPYGMIAQDVDAAAYTGKTLELSAMSKTREVGTEGWKLLINGNAPDTLVYSEPLTGTHDWQRQSVRLKLTPLVKKVTVGAILLDGGEGWLDDVELKVVD
jgi:hypothetical protein